MQKEQLENSIIKFLSNEANEREISDLMEALKSKDNLEVFRSYVETDYVLDKEFSIFSVQSSLKKFESKISEEVKLRVDWRKKTLSYLKYAAVVAIVIMAGMGVYLNSNTNHEVANEITLELEDGSTRIIKAGEVLEIMDDEGALVGKQDKNKLIYGAGEGMELSYNILKIPFGRKFKIELSDGTTIHLNSGSELKYPVNFIAGSQRDVYLDGEAYFEVTKNLEDAFIVHAAGMDTKVFGTEFNVSAYKSDEKTKVVLVEGSVGVFNEKDERITMLQPNEKAELDLSDGLIKKEQVKVEKHIAWKDGVLIFENERFETIIKKLERNFNVEIINNFEEINDNKYTGVFDVESLEEILVAFSSHRPFEYKIKNNRVIIDK